MSRRVVRVCMLRLHDPLHRVNWGGRSTSLALAGAVSSKRRMITASIGAEHILESLCDVDEGTDVEVVISQIDRVARSIAMGGDGYPKLAHLHSLFRDSDELVVNGEGDFILTRRMTLCRTLIMMAAAHRMGLRVVLLNSILSWGNPRRPQVESAMVQAVSERLEECSSVLYRDPESLRLHEQLFASIPASWAPDALFMQYNEAAGRVWKTELGARRAFSLSTEGLPVPIQNVLNRKEPYVVLSGSSIKPTSAVNMGETLRGVQTALQARGVRTIFAASDTPDLRMVGDGMGLSLPVVDPRIPLSAAAKLLWNAEVFISGRYHPSILASLSGTPFALMSSNSHKTRSLLEVMPYSFQIPEQPLFGGQDQVEPLMDFFEASTARRRKNRSEVRSLAAAAGRRAKLAIDTTLRADHP